MADKCSIEDCHRNEVGECELSKLKDHPIHNGPKTCTHYNFKMRMQGERKK